MRPLVGITAWRRALDTYLGVETLQTLSTYYTNAVIDAGMTPVLLPAGQDPAEADRLMSILSGLVLSGGDDVDPGTYGAIPETVRGNDPVVDAFEVALLEAARTQDKPVLAICRGLQILNVAMGGTLKQDVLAVGTVHEPINSESDPDEVNARRHVVTFETGSMLADLYGSSEAKVNTLHHQGIDRIANELIVEARSDDGLIEAARCDGSWWALGVQWHPERMDRDHHEVFHALREAIEAG
jgi:putative glutamine amidotransferase